MNLEIEQCARDHASAHNEMNEASARLVREGIRPQRCGRPAAEQELGQLAKVCAENIRRGQAPILVGEEFARRAKVSSRGGETMEKDIQRELSNRRAWRKFTLAGVQSPPTERAILEIPVEEQHPLLMHRVRGEYRAETVRRANRRNGRAEVVEVGNCRLRTHGVDTGHHNPHDRMVPLADRATHDGLQTCDLLVIGHPVRCGEPTDHLNHVCRCEIRRLPDQQSIASLRVHAEQPAPRLQRVACGSASC